MTDIFIKVVEMSLNASVVIAVIMLLRLALRKAPKVFSYVLWTAALFRLLCPISLELPAAPIPKIEIPLYAENAEISKNKIAVDAASSKAVFGQNETAQNVSDMVQTSLKTDRIPILTVISFIWVFCAATMLLHGAVSWAKLSRRLKSAEYISENIYVSDKISDPFIMGIIRPKIYLPMGLSYAEKELILKHERAHIRRGDHIAKPLMYCALCIHCFDPMIWIMFRLFERDMEMSCDEKVTADMTNSQKADYSQALLKFSVKPTISFAACFGENSTKRRIKNVLSFKKPAVWTVIVLTAAVIAVSVLLCTNRSNNDSVRDYQPSESDLIAKEGTKLNARSNDFFGTEAYIVRVGDGYRIDMTITNMTEAELSADIAQCFGVSYAESFINPAARGTVESVTFAPNESRSFAFDVEDETSANSDAAKTVTGSCDIFIKSLGDKYSHFEMLKLDDPCVENM